MKQRIRYEHILTDDTPQGQQCKTLMQAGSCMSNPKIVKGKNTNNFRLKSYEKVDGFISPSYSSLAGEQYFMNFLHKKAGFFSICFINKIGDCNLWPDIPSLRVIKLIQRRVIQVGHMV